MERQIWPIYHPHHMTMLDRIDMDVIDIRRKIAFVAEHMLPITALPDATFAFRQTRQRPVFISGQCARDDRLDGSPAHGIVGAPGRQPPQAMQVVGQDDDGGKVERLGEVRLAECGAQRVYMRDQQPLVPPQQVDGEGIRATGHPCATIVRHGRYIAVSTGREPLVFRWSAGRKNPVGQVLARQTAVAARNEKRWRVKTRPTV
ncbi:MAG: hypothetical protein QM761_01865 [Pseudoxanthomonas sp.]